MHLQGCFHNVILFWEPQAASVLVVVDTICYNYEYLYQVQQRTSSHAGLMHDFLLCTHGSQPEGGTR